MESSSKNKVRLRNLVEAWNPGAFILYLSTKLVLFFYKMLPDKGADGWRKTTEVHHRNDEAKYIGSIHNLALNKKSFTSRPEARKAIIYTLYLVFEKIPDLHYALKWRKNACIRIPHKFTDMMEVTFGSPGTIKELIFHPDKTLPQSSVINNDLTEEILDEIKKAYNETCLLSDKVRSLKLYNLAYEEIRRKNNTVSSIELRSILERMLSATWINFQEEESTGDSRMAPHLFTNQKHAGFGVLNIHCKHSRNLEWMDVWLQFSHIAIDGRAAAKLQSKILAAFGVYDPNLNFPGDFKFQDKYFLYKYPDRNVFHGCSFVDLAPLLSLRDKISDNAVNVLPISLLLWSLAHHPLFKGVKFNIPVDIPAEGSKERTVGFVFIKPEKYITNYSKEAAFKEYNESLNRQIKGIRKRRIENYLFMQTATMISHSMISLILKYFSSGLFAFTGKTCVTLMEGIEYAIPSLSDNIESIIAVSLIQKGNNTIACVAVRAKINVVKQILMAVDDSVYDVDNSITFKAFK